MGHGARATWFAVVAIVAGLLATGLQVERLFGGVAAPSLVVDVTVPHDALDDLRGGDVEDVWRQRLGQYDVRTAVGPERRADAVTARVTVIGADGSRQDKVLAALTASARLEMVFVAEGDPTMERWYDAVRAGELAEAGVGGEIEAERDSWAVERSGRYVEDVYLASRDAATLERAVTALALRHPLAPDRRVGYERVEPDPGAARPDPYVRTYVLERNLLLTNRDLAGANVEYSEYSLLPEVKVTLTDRGARVFGDATAANIGRKLAILVDGHIVSAPVIQGAIHGGRVAITMGGHDPVRMEREATELAGALSSPTTLPAGLEAHLVAVNERPMGLVWALRALAALLAGAVAVVIAIQAGRRRWFTRAPGVAAGRERWDALAIPALVTCFVPALLWYIAQEVVLPGVNEVELGGMLGDDTSWGARSRLGIFALGITPVLSAFIVVELFAILVEALVPARRGRRLGTADDRRRLDRAAWILVGLLTLLQAYWLTEYLTHLNGGGFEVWFGTKGGKWTVVATLAAGVMVQIVAAELVSRRGLANGYLVLFASAAAVDLAALLAPNVDPRLLDPDRPAPELFLAIAAAAAAATILATRARTGEDGPRLPYAGVVPASLVRGGLALLAVAALGSDKVAERLHDLEPWTPALELAAAAPLTALILWSYRRAWTTPGVVVTLAFVAVLVLLPFAVPAPYRVAAPFAEGVLLGVIAVELWTGALARVRIPDAVTVLVVHEVDRADDAAGRLAAAGIPFALLGVRARAALRFTGAFAPIAVRVPAARAAEAAALVGAPAPTPPPAPPAS